MDRRHAFDMNELFLALLQIEKDPHSLGQAWAFLQRALADARLVRRQQPSNGIDGNRMIESLLESAASTLTTSDLQKQSQSESLLSENLKIGLLKSLAPASCFHGAWLQHAGRLALCETELGAKFLKQFAFHLGSVLGTRIPTGEKFRRLMRKNNIDVPLFGTPGALEALELSCAAKEHAVLDLAISFFPRSLMPELVGFNLWKSHFSNFDLIPFLENDDGAELKGPQEIRKLAVESFDELASIGSPLILRRIQDGFWLAHRAYSRLRDEVQRDNHHRTVAHLFSRKREFMLGHHKHVMLEGRSLDDWHLAPVDDLINALIKAKWIHPGNSKSSPFMRLMGFSGPMFGVFTEDEVRSIAIWVDRLCSDPFPQKLERSPRPLWGRGLKGIDSVDFKRVSMKRWPKKGSNEAIFYLLMNYDLYPWIRPAALNAASKLTERRCADVPRAPVFQDDVLERILERRFKKEVARYKKWKKHDFPVLQAMSAEEKANLKSSVVDGILVASPPAMTDGSWMQGGCDIALAQTEEARILFRTFFDEMGAGNLAWNHIVIHRKELAEMGLTLPDLSDPKFAKAFPKGTGFPIWFMLLGLFPQHFFPEVLGANLAIEPFGVGGVYRIQEEFRRIVGFSGTNARIHNSIDNQVAGHARWATLAIQQLLSRAGAFSSKHVADDLWRRVWGAFAATDRLMDGA